MWGVHRSCCILGCVRSYWVLAVVCGSGLALTSHVHKPPAGDTTARGKPGLAGLAPWPLEDRQQRLTLQSGAQPDWRQSCQCHWETRSREGLAVSEAQRSALHTHSSTHTSLYTDPGPRVWWWWWWCNHGECQSCQCPAPVTWAPPPGPASRLVMVIIQWSLASQYADNFYLEMCVSESTRTKWV